MGLKNLGRLRAKIKHAKTRREKAKALTAYSKERKHRLRSGVIGFNYPIAPLDEYRNYLDNVCPCCPCCGKYPWE